MRFIRGILVFLAASALSLLLFANVAVIATVKTLGSPTQVKGLLAQSGVYNNFLSAVIEQTSKPSSAQKEGENNLPLNNPEVRKAAEAAFSPAVFKMAGDNLVDGFFHWADGQTDKPDFVLNFAAPTGQLVKGIGDSLRTRLNGLPECPKGQVPQSTDGFNMNCRVKGLNVNAEVTRLEAQLTSNADFLTKPITIDGLSKDKSEVGEPKKPADFNRLAWIPKVYQARNLIMVGLLLATVGLAAFIILVIADKLAGWRIVAHLLMLAGLLSLANVVLFNVLSKKINIGGNEAIVRDVALPLVLTIVRQINKVNLFFGVLYTAVAVAIHVIAHRFKSQAGVPSGK